MSIPSPPSTSCRSAPDSGSSSASNRSACSTIDTFAPKRAKTCPSSTPTAPPPSTTSDDGTVSVSMAVAVGPVPAPSWANPGMGGAHALAPVAMTTARPAS